MSLSKSPFLAFLRRPLSLQPPAHTGCLTLPSLFWLTTVIPSWGTICEVVLQAREGRSPAGAAPRRFSSHRGGQHRRFTRDLGVSVRFWSFWAEVEGSAVLSREEGLPSAASSSAPLPPHGSASFFYYDFTFIYLHFYKLGRVLAAVFPATPFYSEFDEQRAHLCV